MRNAFLVLICLIPVLGCSSLVDEQNPNAQNTNNRSQPTATPTASPSPTPTATPKISVAATLKRSIGRYPFDIKMLDMPDLKARLQKLMGKDFEAMKQYWNVETPIEISDKVLKTSGCEQHNCGGNMYVMFVDVDHDNINIYHLNDEGGTKTYFEKGKIDLPADYAADVAVEKQDDDN